MRRLSKRKRRVLVALTAMSLVSLPALIATGAQPAGRQSSITPVIPTADRNEPGKVFLEHADRLVQEEGPAHQAREYQVLVGNVQFRKDNMFMYCDSAYFYEKTNSLDAFSNVRMEQGDSLFV